MQAHRQIRYGLAVENRTRSIESADRDPVMVPPVEYAKHIAFCWNDTCLHLEKENLFNILRALSSTFKGVSTEKQLSKILIGWGGLAGLQLESCPCSNDDSMVPTRVTLGGGGFSSRCRCSAHSMNKGYILSQHATRSTTVCIPRTRTYGRALRERLLSQYHSRSITFVLSKQ